MLENLINGKEKLAVVGMGYVGLPLAIAFLKKNLMLLVLILIKIKLKNILMEKIQLMKLEMKELKIVKI